MSTPQRIMVFGGPGSGKSTLARQLGERTGLPVVHLDQIFWKPGWEERPRPEANAMIAAAQDQEAWIIDGNRTSMMPERAKRSDMMVFLDFPMPVRLWRVTKRVVGGYGRVRPDMQDGCPERFSAEFTWYILRTARGYRRRALAIMADAPERVVKRHLRSNDAVARFLAEFGP